MKEHASVPLRPHLPYLLVTAAASAAAAAPSVFDAAVTLELASRCNCLLAKVHHRRRPGGRGVVRPAVNRESTCRCAFPPWLSAPCRPLRRPPCLPPRMGWPEGRPGCQWQRINPSAILVDSGSVLMECTYFQRRGARHV